MRINRPPVVAKFIYLALSFALPVIILAAVFAINKVFPFGNRHILVNDFAHQYYPFLSVFWHKLRDGTLSIWSWTAGLGHDFIPLFAYYMASPLNWLAFLAPHAVLREMLTLVLLIKIGCAGLFTAFFLHRTFKQNNFSLAIFSSLYALCAFTLGYYWNIIWFDSFALMPLVMAGFLALMREGKYRLYICSLALAVIANFYIGFLICVFTAIAFFGVCIIFRLNKREFVGKLGLIATGSAIAIGMSAFLALPAWIALQGTAIVKTKYIFELFLYHGFFDILGNFISFTPPTALEGLPNLYSGMVCILLAGAFAASPRIALREKLVLCGILVFLLISCNVNVLDYVLHGFHYVNMMPSRYSFIISFILVIMAYRAFLQIDSIKKRDFLAMGISAAVFLLSAVLGSQNKNSIIGSVFLCLIYFLIFFISGIVKTDKGKAVIRVLFFMVIFSELFANVLIAVDTVGTENRDDYPDRNEQIQALLGRRQFAENDFYRTEIIPVSMMNDSSLYYYNGITFFSSTIDFNTKMFIHGLGFIDPVYGNNAIVYYLASPLSNAFLSMRYLITVGKLPPDYGTYWEAVSQAGDAVLLKNKYHLPFGFMVNEEFAGYVHNADNPFQSQNDLFRRATGVKENVLSVKDSGNSTELKYIMQADGFIFAFFGNNKKDIVNVYLNNTFFCEIEVIENSPYISMVGQFAKDDIIAFESGNGSRINVGYLNHALFRQGYALLADEPFKITRFSNTRVSGKVTALQDGVLYASIPGKNWTAYVDGVKSELRLIDKAMAAVRLVKGTHTVEFRYANKSFVVGIIISLVSLAVFAALVLRERRGHGK